MEISELAGLGQLVADEMEKYTPHPYNSGYQVHSVVVTVKGDVFAGANLELPRTNETRVFAFHGEEAALIKAENTMKKGGELQIRSIWISGKNFPRSCGGCSERLYPYCDKDTMVVTSESPNDFRNFFDEGKIILSNFFSQNPMSFPETEFPFSEKDFLEMILKRSFASESMKPQAALGIVNTLNPWDFVLSGILVETKDYRPMTAVEHLIGQAHMMMDLPNGDRLVKVILASEELTAMSLLDRQRLFEFAELQDLDIEVVMAGMQTQKAMKSTILQMLPNGFGARTLGTLERDRKLKGF